MHFVPLNFLNHLVVSLCIHTDPSYPTGQNSPSINSWKLDSLTLKFQLKGALPYSPELLEAQPGLLRYILKQPYSREMVYAVIDIQKKVGKSENGVMNAGVLQGVIEVILFCVMLVLLFCFCFIFHLFLTHLFPVPVFSGIS